MGFLVTRLACRGWVLQAFQMVWSGENFRLDKDNLFSACSFCLENFPDVASQAGILNLCVHRAAVVL